MRTYTATVTWDIPFFGRRENTATFPTFKAAQAWIDACKTGANFVSAFMKKD
jgi:hypothetical protein